MAQTTTNVTMIPAKQKTADANEDYHQKRVAAYCRVSTELEEQQNSYQVQIEYYTNLINSKREWTLAGIFADEDNVKRFPKNFCCACFNLREETAHHF